MNNSGHNYMDPKPISITANRNEMEVVIQWDDHHTSNYPFELLRLGCPCAECRGGHDKMGSEPDPEVFGKHLNDGLVVRLKNIVGVGSYAISPIWEDNHDYGIYNWHYLRALCPCQECRSV
jgi:DUF971 family protein